MPDTPSLRVIFEGAEVQHLVENDRCRVRVKLGRRLSADLLQTFVGEAEAEGSVPGELQSAARAALQALARAFKKDEDGLTLLDIRSVEGFGGLVVLVTVSARSAGDTIRLLGCCEERGRPAEAAAKAALHSTNGFVRFAFAK